MNKLIVNCTLFLICSVIPVLGCAQASKPESHALKRAKEVIGLINTGNQEVIKKYVSDNYGSRFREMPMEAHLNFILSVRDSTRGVEISSVEDTGSNQARVILKTKLTGQLESLFVEVEAEEPYRIIGIGLRPHTAKATDVSIKKLNEKQMREELKAFIDKLVEADVFSGAVLFAKDGNPVFKGAFGVANKDFNAPNKIDTKFNLGSMNKMFTSVAIAQLVEKGKLSFDDPLSKFIPDFPDSESAKKIQIKHLLTHTSGLGGYFSPKWSESSRTLYRTVDDMMKLAAADEKLQFEPGSRNRYSNTGMLVLGKVIEKVTGQSYFDYVRENIYKPAGMLNTDCYELDKVNPNLAIGYNKRFTDTGVEFTNNIFAHVIRGGPQGGGYSTVEDLLKFDIALRSNKLVGADFVKLLLSAKPEMKSPDYGYGFAIDHDLNIAGHGGGFTGISANLDMFLGTGWTAVVMSNYSHGANPILEKMQELVRSQKNGQDVSNSK